MPSLKWIQPKAFHPRGKWTERRVKFTLPRHPQEERAPNWINARRCVWKAPFTCCSPRSFLSVSLHIPTTVHLWKAEIPEEGREEREEKRLLLARDMKTRLLGTRLSVAGMAFYARIWTKRGTRSGLSEIWVSAVERAGVKGRAFPVCVRECGGSPLVRRFRMRDAGWDEIL